MNLTRWTKRIIDAGYRLHLLEWMDDEPYLKLAYWCFFGKKLDLHHPKTYNEKIQWLKLHDRNPEYVRFVDKYAVYPYVKEKIGEQYLIPLLGVWDSFDDIDFSVLPNQFVLKCTHDSGGIAICKDKRTFDRAAAREGLNRSMRKNYFYYLREWPYKDIKPRIIAQAYLKDEAGSGLWDYKFFCFHGEPKVMFIVSDRETDARNDYFDMDFHHLPFESGHPNADVTPAKPAEFEEMRRIAAVLSAGMPHVRVDFFCDHGKVYFGELTMYHWSGLTPFNPPKYDELLGSWIRLP